MADWDDGWYCECCTRANVEDIICIEAERISYSTPERVKLFEHYFCEKCAQEILELIEKTSR